MKALPWIIAGSAIAIALVYVVNNAPAPAYATADEDVEDAARKTSAWGTNQRLSGTGGDLFGKVKEGVGRATGDDRLAGEGAADQVVGSVKDVAGKAAHAVSDTVRELNR